MSKPTGNFPATLADLNTIDTAMPFTHNGRPYETNGQTLARMMGEAPPDPLPEPIVQQLAATFAVDPAAWGRLFIHCITAARNEEVAQ